MDNLRLSLRQLRIFAAVARQGSTTAAGQALGLSQSATSSAVSELERLLGSPLFDRAGKRLVLNDSGRALLPRALALLDGAAALEAMVRGGESPGLALRIGASTTIANYVLPDLLARHLAPQLTAASAVWQARVVVDNTAAICAAVAAFELDVGLVEGPAAPPVLDALPWRQDELVLVAAPQGALARAATAGRVAWPALRDAVWLLREPGSGTREVTDRHLLPSLGSYRRSLELGSSEAIQRAAAAGLGVACLSSWVVADAIAAGRLCRLDAGLPPLLRQCHVVVHRDKQRTPALQAWLAEIGV